MGLSTCDVLVVGGGGAGLRAAIAVAETHPRLRVAVISKVYPMRSHTVSAEGGAAAAIKAEDSLDAHAYDTISGGDWLCDQDAVEAFVREAPEEMLRLESAGIYLPSARQSRCRRSPTNCARSPATTPSSSAHCRPACPAG
jgi:succinate dehydrogenase/fumarate reductase flavoprotein subunit